MTQPVVWMLIHSAMIALLFLTLFGLPPATYVIIDVLLALILVANAVMLYVWYGIYKKEKNNHQ